MEKAIVLVLVLMLAGCGTNLVKPSCAEIPVYKRYDIQLPERPNLLSSNLSDTSTEGEVARSYQLDLYNLVEYSLQLENLLEPIVSEESGYTVEPIPNLDQDHSWYEFWK